MLNRMPNILCPFLLIWTYIRRHITEHDIDAELMTTKGGSPPVDILIRTSGVKRLSDFLLWQVRQLEPVLYQY